VKKIIFINSRGQFFSPDLVIALGVFIFALIVFFTASTSIFSQSALFDERKSVDETAHMVLNSLVLSTGSPSNWENLSISSATSIGLVSSNNEIYLNKIVYLIQNLNDAANYVIVKEKLGLGPYNLNLRLIDSSGNVISKNGVALDGGVRTLDPKLSYKFTRFVVFEGSAAVIEAIFSIEK